MPRLYCERCGREEETAVVERQDYYREEGETVLIVKGRLKSGPWLCDRCNADLTKNTTAYLTAAFPRWVIDQMPDYDLAEERRYYDVRKADVAVYGADWPGVRKMIETGRIPLRDQGQRRQRPVSAQGLWVTKPDG